MIITRMPVPLTASTGRNGFQVEYSLALAHGSVDSTDGPAFTVVLDLGRASLLAVDSVVGRASLLAVEGLLAEAQSHAAQLSAAAVTSEVEAVSAAEAVFAEEAADTVVVGTVADTGNFPLKVKHLNGRQLTLPAVSFCGGT
jgi:hypothetical protein